MKYDLSQELLRRAIEDSSLTFLSLFPIFFRLEIDRLPPGRYCFVIIFRGGFAILKGTYGIQENDSTFGCALD